MLLPGNELSFEKPPMTDLREITAEETHSLRHAILRQNQPIAACAYPGDDDPQTAHFGAYMNGDLVGIASLYREDLPDAPSVEAWRLRGMATVEAVRGQGHGRRLLRACIDRAASERGEVVWCNARASACAFYAREGFSVEGEEFELPQIGPHFLMKKLLT